MYTDIHFPFFSDIQHNFQTISIRNIFLNEWRAAFMNGSHQCHLWLGLGNFGEGWWKIMVLIKRLKYFMHFLYEVSVNFFFNKPQQTTIFH